MWIWTSSALLATLLVTGLSFPHPDDNEYKIPTVGTGQRSQYYVLHKDGTYKYGFDTGDGAFESVKSHTLGSLDGKFGYVDPDGNVIKLEYEAGRGGFVARGDHLPKPSPELAQALAAVVRRTEPFVDPLAGGDSDASYGFKFQSDDHSRTEEADSDGTVTGSYSYTDENGVVRRFTYKAGKGIGFVIEGDGLTVPIETPSTKTNLPSRTITPDFRQSTSFSGNQATIHSTRSETPGSAAYSFSYDADDHSRREVSDDDLNIEGSFSFVADDGQRRTLNYEAGSNTGFVAHGEHLPVAPAFDFGNRLSHGTRSSQTQRASVKPSQYRAPIKTNDRTGFTPAHGQRSSQSVQQTKTKQSVSQSAGITGPGSQTSTSSRQRGGTGTSQTSVKHKTSVAGTSASYSPSSQKIGQQALTRTSHTVPSRTVTTTKDKITSSDIKTRQQTTSQRQSSSAVGAIQSHQFPSPSFKSTPTNRQYEAANVRSSSSPDGSYSFSYDTSSHSRSETGDAKNNVNGKFKFIASDDGEERKIVYEAGSATGFIAEGEHIPIGPIVPGSPSGQPTGRIVPVVQVPFVDPLADSDTDASYNFKFDSETYSRSETADEDGNIVGTYTVVDDDGTRVTYRFRAGKGIGYETEEISRTQGPKPVKPTPYSGPLASDTPATQTNQGHSSFTNSFTPTSGSKQDTSFGIKRVEHPSVSSVFQSGQATKTSGPVTKSSGVGTGNSITRKTSQQTYSSSGTKSGTRSTSSGSSSRTSQSSSATAHQDSSKSTAIKSGSQTTSRLSGASASTAHTGSTGHLIPSKVDLKSAFHPSHTQQVFPGFKLFSYAPSPSAEKYGYVLKFDN